MRKSFATLIAIVVAVFGASLPARAAGPVVYSGPGSIYSTYTTPVVAVEVGSELTYLNTDIALHDVTAKVFGSDDKAWCGPFDPTQPESAGNPRQFALGKCPLFWSQLVGVGGLTGNPKNPTPVLGTESLVAGQTYPFTCSIHPGMFGTLVALPKN